MPEFHTPKYLTPLPSLLAAAFDAAINDVLSMDDASPARLAQLDQRLVQLDLEHLAITLYFGFSTSRVSVSLEAGRQPDTVISGSPAALFAMALPDDGHWGTPGSRVKISGDATLARDLERLFSRLDPDWEGRLSNWFGDVAGYQIASGARGAVAHMKSTAAAIESMTAEFLQRPGSPLAQTEEVRQFSDAVDSVRDATERLEARLRILREQRNGTNDIGDRQP